LLHVVLIRALVMVFACKVICMLGGWWWWLVNVGGVRLNVSSLGFKYTHFEAVVQEFGGLGVCGFKARSSMV